MGRKALAHRRLVLCPLLVGVLRDTTHSFDLPFRLLVLVAVAMVGLTPFLTPKQKTSP